MLHNILRNMTPKPRKLSPWVVTRAIMQEHNTGVSQCPHCEITLTAPDMLRHWTNDPCRDKINKQAHHEIERVAKARGINISSITARDVAEPSGGPTPASDAKVAPTTDPGE